MLAVLHHLTVIPVARRRRVAIRDLFNFVVSDREEPSSRCAYQELAIRPFHDGCHTRLLFVERVVDELVGGIVITRKSCSRAYPQLTIPVAVELYHDIAAQRGGVVRMMQVSRKTITIESVKTILCGYPHIAIVVLADVVDESARESFCWKEVACLSH